MGGVIVNGRYELGEPIGTGGEAQVYRARDVVIDVEVALRLSPVRATPESRRPFPPHHPGWVRMLDRGIDSAHGEYAAFELLHGETLGAMVARGTLRSDAWQMFVHQSLEAVGALHRAGWVHGDLNADNFLFHDNATWKLLDLPFHHIGPEAKPSALFGSIFTMAPEQFEGRAPDRRSDLYALGCLYYAGASGVYPHAGGSEADIAVGRLRFPAAPLHQHGSFLTTEEALWVMGLLARDSADRPADVEAACRLLMRTQEPGPKPG